MACVEELAGKFERRAEDGDRRRLLKSVHEMHRLSNRLATVQVYITTTETESDDPEAVAHVARENRDELLRIGPLVAEGDLPAARERTGS